MKRRSSIERQVTSNGPIPDGSTILARGQFLDGKELLKVLFPESCRPSLRWLREQQKRRSIPFVKLGRLVFFDADQVREALQSRQLKS